MNYNCSAVAVGQPLSYWQQIGLKLVARTYGGQDVIFAIDLTDSVGLNEEGRIRLTQIIEDSLSTGDTVYIVPFASQVNPLKSSIEFRGKQEDVKKILELVPFQSDLSLRNTDIQQAEAYVYSRLAQLNQCRLTEKKAIKPQSVIWLTDAPLLTSPGITSDVWIETPANSPYRLVDSEESVARNNWIRALPLKPRSQKIETHSSTIYELTVVDIAPTVQEFCTPSPGGKETCLVNTYILRMLWLPMVIFVTFLIVCLISSKYVISLNKQWRLKVIYESDDSKEQQTCYLKNKQKIMIGNENLNHIYCPDNEIRGYLVRKGNNLYLKPTKIAPLYYRDREILKEEKITSNYLRLNCPCDGKNFDIVIKLIRN
ncbi:MAG: VWA domain-containing protein [Xenococcus sp. (in: cyanobacteria)]